MRGKAIRRDGCIGLRRDHPRVCGEKYQLGVVKPLHEGSPPRMRGKAYKGADQTTRRGITPAYAGKRRNPRKLPHPERDHPRVCGEKLVYNVLYYACKGSPPRMRGKGRNFSSCVRPDRITPAYAGKSIRDVTQWLIEQDHPRVCGEKYWRHSCPQMRSGSPPRMRGKEFQVVGHTDTPGITPAYAGKRLLRQLRHITSRDHPRVCGEKTKKIPSHRPFQLHPVPVSFSFA